MAGAANDPTAPWLHCPVERDVVVPRPVSSPEPPVAGEQECRVKVCRFLSDQLGVLRGQGERGAQAACLVMMALSAFCSGPSPALQAVCGQRACEAVVATMADSPTDRPVVRQG